MDAAALVSPLTAPVTARRPWRSCDGWDPENLGRGRPRHFDRPGTSNGPTEALNGRLDHPPRYRPGLAQPPTISPDPCSRPAASTQLHFPHSAPHTLSACADNKCSGRFGSSGPRGVLLRVGCVRSLQHHGGDRADVADSATAICPRPRAGRKCPADIASGEAYAAVN